MNRDEVVRVWTQVGRQSGGEPLSVAHVCAAAVAGVGADGAAVSLMVNSTVRDMVHATNQVAGELEEWQVSFGQGPCVDALAAGGPVLAVDLGLPDYSRRWPVFTPAALDSGARAVFALPLQVGAIRLGVMDLYRARPGGLSPYELSDALAFADAAGILLLEGAAAIQLDGSDWQDDPTAHQAQVHQATGMILAQLGISAEAAFARLRAYAFAHDRRIGDVARDVVGRKLRFQPDPIPDGDDDV